MLELKRASPSELVIVHVCRGARQLLWIYLPQETLYVPKIFFLGGGGGRGFFSVLFGNRPTMLPPPPPDQVSGVLFYVRKNKRIVCKYEHVCRMLNEWGTCKVSRDYPEQFEGDRV